MSDIPTSPALRPNEVRGLVTAVGFMTAGEAGGISEAAVRGATTGARKLGAAPALAKWLPFSGQELRLLALALENGAEGILQPSSGYNAAARATFRQAANRLVDAAGLMRPRF